MVLTAEVPAPMYAHLPRTRREYENIHGVNRHDAWIEKYQSDTYLEEYYARKDDTLAFAGELYPEYVLVILTRRYTFPSYGEELRIPEPHTPDARATLSMRIGVSHYAYMSFNANTPSISPELFLAQYETSSGWIFDEVLAPRWVTSPEFRDNTFLLELPRQKVYSLMTVAAHLPENAMKRGLAEEVDAYLDILQKEHPQDESSRYPRPTISSLARFAVPAIPRRPRVLPPSWKTDALANIASALAAVAQVVAATPSRPQSLPPSYRAPQSHGMMTRSYGELYKLRLRNRSIGRKKYDSLP